MLADLASTSESSGDTELWQDIGLKQVPDKKNGQYNQYVKHSFSLQPTAEIVQAHEKPVEDDAHEDEKEAPVFLALVTEENIDRSRSAFGAPHLGHFIGPLSLKKTICSNS